MCEWALAPAYVKTLATLTPAKCKRRLRTFFATTRTAFGKALFQSDRMAALFIDVLRD